MLIERSLEEKILATIASVVPMPSVTTLVGFWEPSAAGTVKAWETDASSSVLVGVITSLGSQTTFTDPDVTFSVAISLNVRMDVDAENGFLATYAEAFSELFKGWMLSTYQQSFTDLDIDGLSIDNVGVQGGSPEIDRNSQISRVGWTLTLSGSYQPTSSEGD